MLHLDKSVKTCYLTKADGDKLSAFFTEEILMNKRIIAGALAFLLVACFTACNRITVKEEITISASIQVTNVYSIENSREGN